MFRVSVGSGSAASVIPEAPCNPSRSKNSDWPDYLAADLSGLCARLDLETAGNWKLS